MYCSACGKKCPDDAVFCAYCGEKIVALPSSDELIEDTEDAERAANWRDAAG